MKEEFYNFVKKVFSVIFFLFLFSVLTFVFFHFQFVFESDFEINLTEEEIDETVIEIKKQEKQLEEKEDKNNETVVTENKTENFSVSKIVDLTNKEREKEDLRSLQNSEKLNFIAYKKAKDIIDRDYFAHISPTGEGAADLAEEAGYEYLLIGENLAKGVFENNEEIVTGWMESPPHRENILKPQFTEIGVAIEKGIQQGREVRVGVQIFATPASNCPEVDQDLLNKIKQFEELMNKLTVEIDKLKIQIEEGEGNVRKKIDEYNELVNTYNDLKEEIDLKINQYNNQVTERNNCFNTYTE
jgi:uncharacterized protein YkwD